MFGTIDHTLKPKKPKIFLCKPNKKVIGKLNKFIFNINQTINLGNLNELSFNMPYEVENHFEHKLIRNPHIDNILERYLLKVQLGDKTEWYIINDIKDDMSDVGDIKSVHAYSLGYELADKLIRSYDVTAYSLYQVANETVAETLWKIGQIDSVFEGKFRSFDVTETTALDFIFQVAETFGALVEFDTVNRLIHFRDPEKFKKQPLTIGYGKYLKTLGKTSNSDEMVTRLYVYGKDNLSINRVNPAGTDYLEDFSYFMYPFERDENRNVIKSSRYMSDSLCHALLDYNELLRSKDGVFNTLLDTLEELQVELAQKQIERFNVETELKIIQSTLDVQRAHETYFYRDNTYENETDTVGYGLRKTSYYAVMLRVYDNRLQVNIDGNKINPPKIKEWFVAKKITDKEVIYVNINGTGRIEIVICEISLEEYNDTNNEQIIERYNEFAKKEQLQVIEEEIEELELEVTDVENQIQDFQEEISIENNFTPEQIEERKQFIISRTWTDENYFDDHELFEAAKEKFLEYKLPKTTINLDVVNFKEILTEQRNWNKLNIGDEIRIRYDKIGVDIRARIISIQYDYDNQTIKLTIANIRDLFGDAARLLEMLKSSYSTSTSVEQSKGIWNEAVEKARYANEKLNQAYDAAEQRIKAGTRHSIDISERGLVARSPDNPEYMVIIQAGIIGLSLDGGLNWQTAIMPEGIVAQRLIGKVIVGENLEIGDEEGTFLIKGNLLTVKDRQDVVRLLLGEYKPDKFGLKLFNKSGHDVILDEDGILQTWQEGRADNVNRDNGLSLWVYIPEETLEIRHAKLRFKLLPFRSYSGTTESVPAQIKTSSGGGGTSTTTGGGGGTSITSGSGGGVSKSTESGGSTTQTSSYNGTHRHLIASMGQEYGSGTKRQYWTRSHGTGGFNISMYIETGQPGDLYTQSADGGHTHSVSIPAHSHSFSTPNHTHTITLNNHTHNVTIPNHTHTVEIPAHKHSIVHDIYQASGKANGIRIFINGIERTSALGGKFYTDEKNIDITQYLAVGTWNEIELRSDTLGRIDANIFIQAFMGT